MANDYQGAVRHDTQMSPVQLAQRAEQQGWSLRILTRGTVDLVDVTLGYNLVCELTGEVMRRMDAQQLSEYLGDKEQADVEKIVEALAPGFTVWEVEHPRGGREGFQLMDSNADPLDHSRTTLAATTASRMMRQFKLANEKGTYHVR